MPSITSSNSSAPSFWQTPTAPTSNGTPGLAQNPIPYADPQPQVDQPSTPPTPLPDLYSDDGGVCEPSPILYHEAPHATSMPQAAPVPVQSSPSSGGNVWGGGTTQQASQNTGGNIWGSGGSTAPTTNDGTGNAW